MLKLIISLALLTIFSQIIKAETPEITIIPPYNDISIEYIKSFPFDTSEAGLNETIKEKFYEYFKKKMEENTNFSKVYMDKPDLYPYYEKSDGTNDWQLASIPPKGFTFKFKDYIPDYVLEFEDVTYSYGSIENGGMKAFNVGLALSGITSDFSSSSAGYYIIFRYNLWDNKDHKVLQCGKLVADEVCCFMSKSEWEDLIYEMVEKLFEKTEYFIERE